MSEAEIVVGALELFGLVMGVFVFCIENGRLPGTYLSWSPYVTGRQGRDRGEIIVGVRRKSRHVCFQTIDPTNDDFDERLAAAESEARERCVQLNASLQTMKRRLPA